jgi:predicted RND superfamily exporter protein
MESGEEVQRLLTEIRDLEREHLAEYRRVSGEVLDLQRVAVARQELFARVYRRVVLMGAVLASAMLVLLVYLLARWWRPLFGM